MLLLTLNDLSNCPNEMKIYFVCYYLTKYSIRTHTADKGKIDLMTKQCNVTNEFTVTLETQTMTIFSTSKCFLLSKYNYVSRIKIQIQTLTSFLHFVSMK